MSADGNQPPVQGFKKRGVLRTEFLAFRHTQGDLLMKLSAVFTATALLSSAAAFAQSQQPPATTPPPEAAAQSAPAAPAGQADEATARMSAIFEQMNTSHTGQLTKDEAKANSTVAASFDNADTNHDGVLTKEEFLAAFKPAPQ